MKYLSLVALLLLAGCKIEQGNYPESPDSSATETISHDQTDMSAAKVAAVMAAEGITLPQVASYLNTYGFDVIQRSEFRRWHWTPPTSGAPVAYYVVNFRVAVGDTTLPIYIPQGAIACPYSIRVKGLTGQGVEGPWSYSNVSGAGALLPGVQGE